MKKKSIKLLVMALVLTISSTFAVGCTSKKADSNSKATTAQEEKKVDELEVFKTSSNLHEISLPKKEGWIDLKEKEEDAVLQKSDKSEDKLVMIIEEPRSDFAENLTLKDYCNLVIEVLKQDHQNVVAGEFKDVKINGKPAMQFEVSCEIDKVKFKYLTTAVDDGKVISRVVFGTTPDKFDKSKDSFITMTTSFK